MGLLCLVITRNGHETKHMVTRGSALSERNVSLPSNQFSSTEVLAADAALGGRRKRPQMSLTAQIEGPIAVVYPRNLVLSLFFFFRNYDESPLWRISGKIE